MEAHEEICVRVNAWIDKGVAPLVTALNEIERVVTVDSCEGGERPAHVMFGYQGSDAELIRTVEELARVLATSCPDAEYRLQLQWANGGEHPLAMLTAKPDQVSGLASAVAEATSSGRMRRCQHGSHGKALRSC